MIRLIMIALDQIGAFFQDVAANNNNLSNICKKTYVIGIF